MIDLDHITPEQWAEGMGKPVPGEQPTTNQAAPTEPEKADAPAETPPQPTGERPRNPDGTFAARPAGDGQNPAEPPAPAAPFDGFEKLDPAVQAQFRRLTGERDDFKLRYTRLNGEYRRVTRQQQSGSGREAQPVPQQARSGANTQVGQAAQGARQSTAQMQPGPERDAVQRQIDAWEKHAHDYPDDAKAIEQRLGKLSDDVTRGLAGPLLQEINHLRNQLGSQIEELRGQYQSFADERAERLATEHQQTLDEVAGDNWRQIAGWEDENGNPIPRDQWEWHPEFVAWVNGRDPDEAGHIWESLANSSPRVVGKYIREFNLDRFGLDAAQGQNGQAAPSATGQRRADSLRDIAPGARGTAKPSGAPVWEPSGNEYVDAVRSPAYREWQKA